LGIARGDWTRSGPDGGCKPMIGIQDADTVQMQVLGRSSQSKPPINTRQAGEDAHQASARQDAEQCLLETALRRRQVRGAKRLGQIGKPSICDLRGAGALAVETAEASVQMPCQGLGHRQLAGCPALNQGDPPARRVRFVARLLEGRAVGKAQSAFDALIGELQKVSRRTGPREAVPVFSRGIQSGGIVPWLGRLI
jgi:hypothetical protein